METITAIVDFIHKTRNYYNQFNRQYYADGVAQYNLKKLTMDLLNQLGKFKRGLKKSIPSEENYRQSKLRKDRREVSH